MSKREDIRERRSRLSPAKLLLLEKHLRGDLPDENEQDAIPRREGQEFVALSFGQERLYFLSQFVPDSPFYNVPLGVRLKGSLNIDALERSLSEIVRRHEALRTNFNMIDGQLAQVINPALAVRLPLHSLESVPAATREEEARRVAIEEVKRPFDLAQEVLLRCMLFRLQEQDHVLLLVLHHIIFDDWSKMVFTKEMATLYEAFSEGKPSPLSELPIQYADYAMWQRSEKHASVLKEKLSYWKRHLDGSIAALELPTDRPRPAIQTFRGAVERFDLPAHLFDALKALSHRAGVTLFTTLLAAFKALLYRYTSQQDITVGTPIAGRNRAEIEDLIGFFSNTLVLRTPLAGRISFSDLMAELRDVTIGAFEHQDVPFERLVEELQPERDPSRQPFFQVVFVLQNVQMPPVNIPGLTLDFFEIESGTAKFDLNLTFMERGESLNGFLEYNVDLFDASTVNRMLEHFRALLEAAVACPEQSIAALPMLSEKEMRELLVDLNDTRTAYPRNSCIHQLFEAQADRAPQAIAVIYEGERITYEELNNRANQLARHLRGLGIGPESLVGICVERSPAMVVGLLAILKAGGAYLPLDPVYPIERLAFMLGDAQISVLLTQESLESNIPSFPGQVVLIDADWDAISAQGIDNMPCETGAENLSYVTYTSGSTGSPKGIEICHRGVIRLLFGSDYVHLSAEETFLQISPVAFDASTFELWGALLHGARCVLYPARIPTIRELRAVIDECGATTLWLTASLFNAVIDEDAGLLSPVRQLLVGGEALSVSHIRRALEALPSVQIINGYGPTESTTFACCYPIPGPVDESVQSIPIGRPIGNTQAYILSPNLQVAPAGVAGELHIGGDGLARAYLHDAELTAQRFIPNPFGEPGSRLYKTGDLSRYVASGAIEFLGRIDHQIKIRGFRIEPGEIESALVHYPGVRQAVVTVNRDKTGSKFLAAYVVCDSMIQPKTADLKAFLMRSLPEYMLPSAFIKLDAMPITARGKVDREALLAINRQDTESSDDFTAPRTGTEELLAAIWSQVLDVERVGIDNNFFDLGGDSIRSIQVISRAQERGLSLSITTIFQHQTIRELAEALGQPGALSQAGAQTEPFDLVSEDDRLKLPGEIEDAYPVTMLQRGMLFHSQWSENVGTYNDLFSAHLELTFDLDKLQRALDRVVSRHAALRTFFDLAGFSEPLQLVRRHAPSPIQVEDLRGCSSEGQERLLSDWLEAERRRGFDWGSAPLFRIFAHLRAEDAFQFTLSVHHSILDGWSVASMLTELFSLYCLSLDGEPLPEAEPLASTYRDFVALELAALKSEQASDYWDGLVSSSSFSALPGWPLDGLEDASQGLGVKRASISDEVFAGLTRLARQVCVPVKSVLLAAHMRVMCLLSGQADVLTGLVSNGRSENAAGDKVLGLFLNTLPFRLNLEGGTWSDLVKQAFEAERAALPFRRYPMAELQRKHGAQPLFESIFNYTNYHVYKALEGLGKQALVKADFIEQTNFPLSAYFDLDASSSNLALSLHYHPDKFPGEQIEATLKYYTEVLKAMASDPQARYESVGLLPEWEQRLLLGSWNDNYAGHSLERCAHHLFEAQCERTPGAIAAAFKGEQLTYGELNRRANQLAHRLTGLGVGPEILAGIYVERSLEMVVAMLGILKAGGAYVPLDPDYPRDRLAFMLEDARLAVIVTQERLADRLPESRAEVLYLDRDRDSLSCESEANPVINVTAANVAYTIYTSGSTGKPKGVMITHRSVVNFFAGMDRCVEHDRPGVWLAVTSISFDISVLELMWTLSRGFKVVIQSDGEAVLNSFTSSDGAGAKGMDFSLFYFASDDTKPNGDKYKLLLEGARFADRNGFSAIWTPERHFHAFGGIYPNPSVTSAAIASITERVQIRAGSVVLPLHDPIRVAEEWAVVDNISNGRVGISFASGWHANDFVLAPESYSNRKELMFSKIKTVQKLWKGEPVTFPDSHGNDVEIKTLPRPVQPELPTWITAAGNPETFQMAGEIGANVLTHLLGQSIDELAERISLYRSAWRQSGEREGNGHVTLMLHTFIGRDIDAVRELARIPFCNYLRSSVDLIANLARSLGQSLESFTEDDWDALLSQAFDRYFETSGLLGTPETCLKMIGRLKAIGVDEIGCLIDFGIDYERVIESLRLLNELRQESNSQKSISAEGYSLPSEIINHGVTHLQCTPSLARVLAQDSEARASLAAIANLFVGGEALPVSLARQLREMMPGRVRNMYGPTETTIWSATHAVEEVGNSIPIGRPILNTEIYVLDVYGNQSPVGVPGELAIGGDGVARGYFNRPGLTAEKFIPNRFSQRPGSRLYKTGDLARFLPCGNLEFLGRTDHQVKVRGFRVETGEVEAALTAHPAISEAAVVVHEDKAGGKRLVAYVVAEQGQVIEAGELRGYILEKLPVFMLPSSFVALGAMPLTLNGKLDRKALILRDVADDPQVKSEMIAPRTETELSLAKIWGDVLGIDRISVDENFFTMGGDSILSLLIIAKANRAGIRLTAKQFFENPTIAGLAAVAITGSGVQAQSSEVTGRLPLTPVQHWFFEQELADPHHYNQSVMLEVREPVAPSSMARVARSLLAHHDALRLRFKRSGAGWEQFNSPCDGASPFIQVDLSLLRGEQKALAINLAATQAQASLNLFEGPLMRVAAYDFGDAEPCRLQVAVHHLAIDGVSWRILLEDLQTAYGQLALGEEIQLSPKTTSFKQWAWSLAEHAQSESIKQESSYWLSALPANKARIPVDFPAGRNTEEHSRVLSIDLGADDTVKLLRRAPEFYRSEINDVLLLALARAFARWTGEGSLLVDVENMGRAELFEDVDLSRTVGWHTSLYPVLLNAGQADDLDDALRAVKERLRSVPNRGIGYGLLRYLSRDIEASEKIKAAPRPEVIFNYLGQFDQVMPESSMLSLARESAGVERSKRGIRSHLFEVVAIIIAGRLRVDWKYSKSLYDEATVKRLASWFRGALREIIARCDASAVKQHTASDFADFRWSQADLDNIAAAIEKSVEQSGDRMADVMDFYPLSPIQEGVLFHTLYSPNSQLYILQRCLEIRGGLDLNALEWAWQQVINRNPVLRTFFVWEGGREPVQAVFRDLRVQLERVDWRGRAALDQERLLESLLEADRDRGFQLSKAPLIRSTIIRLDENIHRFIYTFHFLLLDGWSEALLLKELFAFYKGYSQNKRDLLERGRPYRDYVAWLAKEERSRLQSGAEMFWRKTLDGLTSPTRLEMGRALRDDRGQGHDEQQLLLPGELTAQIRSFTRQHRLTINTLMQGAWALLLSRYTNEQDVVFGATFAGRPAALAGIESMMGLFANTLPVRAQLGGDEPLLSWLERLQVQQAEIRHYDYSSLVEIQSWSDVPRGVPLFDTIFVFENYPVDRSLNERPGDLQIQDVAAFERSNYPLAIVVRPGRSLSVKFIYRRSHFDSASIIEMTSRYERLLRNLIANAGASLSQIEMFSHQESSILNKRIAVEELDRSFSF